ncbi:ATP-binding protein [Kribbella speibonae]|uniref:LuxR family transcriptional regulator n=1 Tax=Kribbella speibonae TaxID=1572660 RepID=A0A4R0IB00_9ACTN|nr:LuxR family transcriptional regulator [Kribbella speibonae]TCC30231.1 LuxR family transcriptional regulator [Kribbella speibonae]
MGTDQVLRGRQREIDVLSGLVREAKAGRSQVLLVTGEAGVGKSALLDALVAGADGCRVTRTAGVESEMELAYAGLHQLCLPFLDHLDRLPAPQREALGTAFGLVSGPAPDKFLIGLAVLNLLADAAGERPVLCVVDDAQWLDLMSARILAFVTRRLAAESVVMVLAVRDGIEHAFTGLTELEVRGLDDSDARALLDSVLPGPIDPRVRDRIVAETRGNPLALLELPRAWTAAELADGLTGGTLTSRLEDGFVRRLEALQPDTRLLLLTAAAEPLGDPTLLWRAAEQLGLGADPAAGAIESGLITFGRQIRFRHPLVRSAAYRTATPQQRLTVHRALADATDPETDPDRRAWHRAQATVAPDEGVAAELERSAQRAQARGGFFAAGMFLERSAALTIDPGLRADRVLAAATAKRSAGALDAALDLLGAAAAGPADAVREAEVLRLRGEIAFDRGHAAEAARTLVVAAKQLDPLDHEQARVAYLEAMSAAIWASGPDTPGILAEAASAAPAPAPSDPPGDLLLQALALRFTHGYAAAATQLVKAVDQARQSGSEAEDVRGWLWLAGNRASGIVAIDVWDLDAALELAARHDRIARDSGALVQLQWALNFRANVVSMTGDLAAATAYVEEERRIAGATGNRVLGIGAMQLAALCGSESEATTLIDAMIREARAQDQGRMTAIATYTSALLNNGLGHYETARDAALQVFEQDVVAYGVLVIGELAEAASRTGDTKLVETALAWLNERVAATPSDWGRGMEARARALLGDDEDAYRASIDHLNRTGLRIESARGELLYGEWLRREGRRQDARAHLRTAHEQLAAMGAEAFAERARRELLATGETVRKRTPETTNDLTAQEAQIAGLARDGLTNPEIAAQLFISPRTVEWHLRKTFSKLGITSRRQLRTAIAR